MVEFLEVRFTEVDVVFVATEFELKGYLPKLENTIILWQIVSLNFRPKLKLPGIFAVQQFNITSQVLIGLQYL